MDYKKQPFPVWVIIIVTLLVIFLIGITGIGIYIFKNPDVSSISNLWLKNKVNKGIHSIYVQTLEDPDKDKDGLEDDIAEKEIYKTNPKDNDSMGAGMSDGEYVYDVYKKALSSGDESKLEEYRANTKTYKESEKWNKIYGNISLEDAFNIRAAQTYNLYVGLPDDQIEIVKEALSARLAGDYGKSLKLLQNAISQNPNSSILQYHLGLTYHGMKEYEKALSIYEPLTDDDFVKSPLLYSDLANANYGLGREDKYVKYLESSIREFPEDLTQYVTLSNYYQEKRQFDKAEEILNKGLKIEPRYASYYNSLALIASSNNNTQKEFELYKKAVGYDFRYASGHLNLSILYDQVFKDLPNALVEAMIAFDLDPENPRYISRLSSVYEKMGMTDKAQKLNEKLLSMDNLDAKTLNDIGLQEYNKGFKSYAEIYYRKSIEADPKLPNPYNNLGIVLSDAGKNTEAITNFKKAIELNPNYTNAYGNLGLLYTDMKEYQSAIQNFKKAIELDSTRYSNYWNIAWVYYQLNDRETARSYYQKAADLGGKDADIFNKLKELSE